MQDTQFKQPACSNSQFDCLMQLMNTHAPNRDLQADFQSIDTRMKIKFNDAIESDDKKRRRSARGFMSKHMDSDPNNPKRFPKLWEAMCAELRHQTSNTTTPISQIREILKKLAIHQKRSCVSNNKTKGENK